MGIKSWGLAFVVAAIGYSGLAFGESQSEYCYPNPTVSAGVKPNILILLDSSGSMDNSAYGGGYDSSKRYYGYAVQKWWYTYNSSKDTYSPDHECTSACASAIPKKDGTDTYFSGNAVNYREMQRIDVALKAIMGGKTNPRISKESTPINSYVAHDKTKIEAVSSLARQTEPSGVLQDYRDNARWALAFFGKNADGANVKVGVHKTNFTDIYNQMENMDPDGGTPLAEALWSATGFFAQATDPANMPDSGNISADSKEGPQYHNVDYAAKESDDPMNYAEKPNTKKDFPECQDNFVLMFTDGEPTQDESTPGDESTPSSGFNSYLTNPDTSETSDFSFTGGSPESIDSDDDELDDVAFYARVNDFGITSGNRSTSITGDQQILFYPFFAFGGSSSAKDILKNAAVNGGFKDQDGDGVPYSDSNCTIASSPTSDYNSGSECKGEWDADLNGIPDNYFEAKSGEIEDQLRAAVSDILKRVSSGSTVATISSQTRSGGALIQAYYRPLETPGGTVPLDWKGYVRGLWTDPKGNLREDKPDDGLATGNFDGTYDDHKLKLAEDRILRFRFDSSAASDEEQVKADLYKDTDGDNVPDTCSASDTVGSTQAETLWEVGQLLASRDPAKRTIKFNNNGTLTSLGTSVAATASNYWEDDIENPEDLIKFIRGYDNPNGNTDFRVRQTQNFDTEVWDGTWKLGPAVTSTPRVIRQGRANNWVDTEGTYYDYYTSDTVTERPSMVLVGANDGMLHAIYAGEISPNSSSPSVSADMESCSAASGVSCSGSDVAPGTEAWSFIPQNAMPYLRWYGDMTADCLIPTVDYRVQVVDAAIGSPTDNVSSDTQSKSAWRTLAIGMMGFGGQSISCDWNDDGTEETLSSSVFVLDITDPESPTLLWEENLDDHSLTLSYPSVVRRVSDVSKNDQNGNWYLVMGSGPEGPEGKNFVGDPQIFVFDLKSGSQVKKMSVGVSNLAVGETVPADPDRDDIADSVYFGTYGGTAGDEGKLYRLNFAANKSDWSINAVADFSSSLGGRPFYAAPGLAKDPQEDVWVYGGTGRFMATEDKEKTVTPQFLFGMRDDCWGDGMNATGSGSDNHNPSGSGCTGSSFSYPMTVDSALVDTSGVTVESPAKTQECRCGGVTYPAATKSDCTGDGGEWVVTLTGDVTYNSCPTDLDCSSPDKLQEGIKAEGGWYRKLATSGGGERIFSQPFVNAGLVNALGFTPKTDKCEPGGITYQYALDYRTGTPPAHVVFLNSSGYDVNTEQVQGRIEVGKGVPPMGEAFASMPGAKEGETSTLTQTSTGELVKNPTKTPDQQTGILFRSEPR